jgi:GNAT superfamily N-acetyltransferase
VREVRRRYSPPAMSATALLATYDAQLRARIPDPLLPGEVVERDGPLLRFSGELGRGWILYRDLGGLHGGELDELIARQVEFFRERDQRFEWKYHGHDLPADLPERLLAHGFVPEASETVVIAPVDAIAGEPRPPEGVILRGIIDRADLEKIDVLEAAVWGEDEEGAGYAEFLEAELAADPDGLSVVIAEACDTTVCAAWIRYAHGTDFAALFGGATLPDYRRRGIYRATVAFRANLARERGFRYLETDASDDSNPILQRLGFLPVTTTTPYIWSPAQAQGSSSQ